MFRCCQFRLVFGCVLLWFQLSLFFRLVIVSWLLVLVRFRLEVVKVNVFRLLWCRFMVVESCLCVVMLCSLKFVSQVCLQCWQVVGRFSCSWFRLSEVRLFLVLNVMVFLSCMVLGLFICNWFMVIVLVCVWVLSDSCIVWFGSLVQIGLSSILLLCSVFFRWILVGFLVVFSMNWLFVLSDCVVSLFVGELKFSVVRLNWLEVWMLCLCWFSVSIVLIWLLVVWLDYIVFINFCSYVNGRFFSLIWVWVG